MPPTHDNTGRSVRRSGDILAAPFRSTTRPYRRNKIVGQFAPRLIEMLESPAYRVMSLSAHRLLARVEIELAHHGGHDNGALPVTYKNCVDFGIERHSIAPAQREIEALGFVQITERGRAGNAEYRTPNKFRLTYRPTQNAGPTEEWKAIKTIEEAKLIANMARKAIKRSKRIKGVAENKTPVRNYSSMSEGNPHRKDRASGAENPHHSQGAETPTTFYISGRAPNPPVHEAQSVVRGKP